MRWLQEDVQTYYDVYKCSNCGAEIMLGDGQYLPCYCKNCEESEEE